MRLVFSNEKEGETHTSIFELYPLPIQLRFRQSNGGLEFQLMRYHKHKKTANNGNKNQLQSDLYNFNELVECVKIQPLKLKSQ